MEDSFDELCLEHKLIILTSYPELDEEKEQKIIDILNQPIDWKEILFQAVLHRTINLLYYHLKELNLVSAMHKELYKCMRNSFFVYQVRNQLMYDELGKVADALNKEEINYAVLKGVYLSTHVYPCIQTRTFNDVDLLINLKDGNKISKILESLGFIQGDYDAVKDEIIPYNRSQKIYHKMATHEMAPFHKKTGNPFLPVIQIDLNYTVLWKGDCPYDIETDELLERTQLVDISGHQVRTLSTKDFLLQLMFHLYREATSINVISISRDLQLYKFIDIAMFVKRFEKELDWCDLVEYVKEQKAEKVFYYVFHYINILYPELIPQEVMERLDVKDKEYLDEYGLDMGKKYKWNIGFLKRLFKESRMDDLDSDAYDKESIFYNQRNLLQ